MKHQNTPSVKSAARAIDTIEHVALYGPVNARSISRATGIPESSLSYLLATLVDRGWLVQRPDRTYASGPALGRLAAQSPRPLVERAQGALAGLAAATGETASLFVRRGDEIEVVDVEHSTHELRFTPQQGSRMPLHCFAGGKALLAELDPEALSAYFARGPRMRFTDRTIVDEDDLRRDLARSRTRGYAISEDEHTIGVVAVGIALDDLHSLSIAIPSPRFDEEMQQRTIAALQQARAALLPEGAEAA